MGTGHGQVITENHPIELQFAAQDVLQPATREAGRLVIHLRVNNVGRHDRGQLLAQARERHQVMGAQLFQAALINRNGHVGICLGPAMTREVLAGGGHASAVHAPDKGAGQQRGTLGITFERARAYNGAALVVEVQHGGEAQVQADGQYFRGHDPTALLGQVFGIGIVRQRPHGRQAHKPLAQALDPTAFLIHSQQQVRAHCANGGAQFPHLARMLDVARKNDQAAHFRLAQQVAIFSRQPGAGDVHH